MHGLAEHGRRSIGVDEGLQAIDPGSAEQRDEEECPKRFGPAAPQRQAEREGDDRIAKHRDVRPQRVARRGAERVQRHEHGTIGIEEPNGGEAAAGRRRQEPGAPVPHARIFASTMPRLE